MENCRVCDSEYKNGYKSDHLKSVKHLQVLNQNYCKNWRTFIPLSAKKFHSSSNEHKQKSPTLVRRLLHIYERTTNLRTL